MRVHTPQLSLSQPGNRHALEAGAFSSHWRNFHQIFAFTFLACLRVVHARRDEPGVRPWIRRRAVFPGDAFNRRSVCLRRTSDDGGTRETDISVDIAKRITSEFGIEIGETLSVLNPHEGQTMNGFGNLELGGKYQLLKNGPHETIVSVGLGVEIGGTGSSSIGADSFSTWAPAICPRPCGS